jgi:glycosyltransferase involved in cell wall biosynthesis
VKKLISVILPVYNGAQYLSNAIESILNQTLDNFEFIIINDGSIDNSIEIIEHYANIDSRIIIIDRGNKGLIYTLNEGIEKSMGEYIARMDQDDISMENRLELQYAYMSDNGLDICGGNYIEIDANSKEICHRKVFQKDYEIFLAMATSVPFPHPSVMIKTEFLNLNCLTYGMNGYRHAEDLDLWMNMHKCNARFGNIDLDILKYRILPTSMSRANIKNIRSESGRQFDKFIKSNKSELKKTFENILNKKTIDKGLQKLLIKTILRYVVLDFNWKIIFRLLKKVGIYNFLIMALPFIKLRGILYVFNR